LVEKLRVALGAVAQEVKRRGGDSSDVENLPVDIVTLSYTAQRLPSSSSRGEKIMIHGRAFYNCLSSMSWPNRIGDDTWRFLSWSWSGILQAS
jgi:hypothetical protein